jgi:hypothetical protein
LILGHLLIERVLDARIDETNRFCRLRPRLFAVRALEVRASNAAA